MPRVKIGFFQTSKPVDVSTTGGKRRRRLGLIGSVLSHQNEPHTGRKRNTALHPQMHKQKTEAQGQLTFGLGLELLLALFELPDLILAELNLV